MKKIIFISIIFSLIPTICDCQLGKAIIDYQPTYENENEFFPHDFFVEEKGILEESVRLDINSETATITNIYNDGYIGHKIEIKLNSNLEIIETKYEEWTDVYDGSESIYNIENIILSLNNSPFEKANCIGHYTLKIKESFRAGKILNAEGISDTINYRIFRGKFKLYDEIEKQNGRDWVLDQNLIHQGVKNKDDIFYLPDEFAFYSFGNEQLKIELDKHSVKRSQTLIKGKKYLSLQMIVKENGEIDETKIQIDGITNSDFHIKNIVKDKSIMKNWTAAKYRNEYVKSFIQLPIIIIE